MATATQRLKTAISGYVNSWSSPEVQAATIKLLDRLDEHLDTLEYEHSEEIEAAIVELDEEMNMADEELSEVVEDDPDEVE